MKERTIESAVDPVCGTRLNAERTPRVVRYQGKAYYFCSPGCRDAFNREPAAYLRKPKGLWGRFLDRLARANDREFGAGGPTCCR